MVAILSCKYWRGESLQAVVNPWSKTTLWGGFLGWLSDFIMLLLIRVMNMGQIGGEAGVFHESEAKRIQAGR